MQNVQWKTLLIRKENPNFIICFVKNFKIVMLMTSLDVFGVET